MRTLLLIPALLLAGCASDWEAAEAGSRAVANADLAPILEKSTVWKGALPPPADESKIVEGRWHFVAENVFSEPQAQLPRTPEPVLVTPEPVAPPPVVEPPRSTRPALPIPKRRATPPPPKRGTPPKKSAADRAREHYLDNPTTVRAPKITFYCPAAFLREVRLTAADIKNTSADRRIARGGARLVCRELTLVADQITLRIRREADAELQVIARGGGVAFISRVRDQATHDEGLRSLILRQDRVIPLR